MADNVAVTPGSGAVLAADEIGGVLHQRVKVSVGADGAAADLAFGQGLAAASLPVVIASNQTAVPVADGGGSITVDGTVGVSGSVAVTGAFWQATQPVSAAALPLPTGAATETTLAALSAKVPALGQAAMAASQPVVIATNQTAVPVSDGGGSITVDGTVGVSGSVAVTGGLTDTELRAAAVPVSAAALPLPTGASTEATLATMNGKIPALGQAAMAASQPVAIASDQSAISTVEQAVLITGAAAQTAVVNNILPVASGAAATDVANFRAMSVQVVSTGTGGTFIFEQSADNVNFVALPVFNAALVTAVPITAAITATASAIIYTFPVRARFVRLRIATTITGGSIQAFSRISSEPWTPSAALVASNTAANLQATVSGTVTANIGTGALAAGANAIGDVGQQYRANATGAASFVSVMSPATPVATVCKAGAGRLLGLQLQNSAAAIRSVKFWNTAQGSVTLGTTAALFEVDIPAGGRAEWTLEGGIGFATAITFAVTGAKGLTDNTGTLGVNDVSGSLFFA